MATMTGAQSSAAPLHDTPALRGRVMALLLLAYVFNFVDRSIISILKIPIKAEFGLTDTQLGLLGGLAFALLYTGLGIPVAWLADRSNRVRIVATAMAVWSLMTAVCGAATGFWSLFLARMGVGVGEAGGVAPSYSLVTDYYPPQSRARALAFFSFGIPIGTAFGLFAGGYLAQTYGWRTAFVVIGLAGVLVAPLLLLFVPEPPRGRYDVTRVKLEPVPFGVAVWRVVRIPSFWFLSLGAACSSTLGYGLAFWLPTIYQRQYGLPLTEVGAFSALITLVGGLAGIWFGGWLGDRLGGARPGAFALVPAIAFFITPLLYLLALAESDLAVAAVLLTLATALSLAWLGPVNSAVQHIVPPNMRAVTAAMLLFVNNLIGLGLGPTLPGVLSDHLAKTRPEAEALRLSLELFLLFYVAAGIFLLLAAWRLRRDWWREPEESPRVVSA